MVRTAGMPAQEIITGSNGHLEEMVVDEGSSQVAGVIAMQFNPRTLRCLDKQLSFARQLHTRKVGLEGMEEARFKHIGTSVVEKYAIIHNGGTVKGAGVRWQRRVCVMSFFSNQVWWRIDT